MKISQLERVQAIPLEERLSRWARQIEECPFLRGVLVELKLQADVPVTLPHGLPNRPQGVLPLAFDIPAAVAVTDINQRTITVRASADCNAKLWVW